MPQTFAPKQHFCATCTHWFGNRTVKLGGALVEAESMERGSCNHPNRVGTTSRAADGCGRWVKQGSLR